MKLILIGALTFWAGLAFAQEDQQYNIQQEPMDALEAIGSEDADDRSDAGNVSPSFDVVQSAESFFFNARVLSDRATLDDFQKSAKNAVFDLVCVNVFERFASFETSPEEEREDRAREFVAYWSFLEGYARLARRCRYRYPHASSGRVWKLWQPVDWTAVRFDC